MVHEQVANRVTPVKVGIYNYLKQIDSRFRWDDIKEDI
jgi:hypothetical protein